MKTIIAATDLSRRGALAVDRAEDIARATGAELLIAHAIDDDQPRELVERQIEQADGFIRSDVARRSDSLRIGHRIIAGDVCRALQSAATEAGADLIVAGDHRRSPVRDAFRDTTIERLIRYSSIPVLVARTGLSGAYAHALIGVETEEAAELIAVVESLGAMAPQRISALNAFDAVAAGMMANVGADRQAIAEYRQAVGEEARRRVRSSIPAAVRGKVQILVVGTDPAPALQQTAEEEGCDLIVVSTHARRGILRGLLGSVSSDLIRHGSVDLLVVPRAAQNGGSAQEAG